MIDEQIDALVNVLCDEINGWSDMVHLRIHYADDGDGHSDFMGMSVRPEGRESLRAAIARAAERDELLAWRPIETAPKDGRQVLLGRAGWGAVLAQWCDDGWIEYLSGELYGTREPTHWSAVVPVPPKA